ncbi:Nucleic-acid-binding protein from transposon X-element [Anthophora quadrimaculata]
MLMCSANHYTDANGHTTLVYRFSSDHRSQAALGTVPCDPSPRYKCLAAWKPVPIPRSSMLMCSANHYTDANGHTTLVYRFSSDHRSQAALGTVPCDPSPRYKCLAAWKPVPIPRSSMLMCSANHYTDANGHTTLVYRFSSDHRSQAALGTVPCDPSPRYKCLAAWKPVPIPRSSMLMCSANHYTDANGHTTLVYRFSSDHRSQAALGTVPCDPSPRYKCLAAWKPVPIPRSSMLMCSANHYTDANGHTTLVYRFSSDHRSQAALGTVPCDPSPRYKFLAAWKPVPIPRSSMLMCSANHYTDANGHTTLVYRFSSDHRSQAALGTVPCDPSPRYKCLAAWKPVPIPRSSMLMCSANHYTDANGHTTLVYRFSSDHRSQAALGTVPCDPSPRYKCLAAWKPVPIPRSSMLMCSANHYTDANGHTTLVYRFSSDHRSQAALGTVPCDPSPRYKCLAAWKPVPIPRSSMLMCSANHYTDANGHTTLVYRFSSDHRSQAALGTVPCDPSPRYKCLAAWKPVPIPRSSMLMCKANHYTDANGHTTLVYRFSSDHRSQAALGTVPCDPSPRYKCLAAWKPVPIPRSSMLMCSANHYTDANGHTTLVYRFSSDHRSQAALGTVPCDPSPRYKCLAAWKPVPIPRSSMLMCSANHYTDANGHTTLVYRFSSDHRSQAALGTVPCDPSPRYKCLAAWKPVPIPRSSMLMCSANHYTDANGHTTLVYRFSSDHRSQAALGTVPCDPSPRYKCLAAWKPVPIPRSSMLMCSANHYTDANGHTTLVYRFSSDHRSQAALGTVPCDPSPRYKCLAAWKPVPIPRSSMLMCSANHYTDANGHTTLVYRFSSDHRSQAALGTVPCDPSPRYKCLAAWKPVPIPRSSMLMCSANHYTDANGHTTLVYRFSSDHRSQAALGTVPCDPSPRYKCLAAWKPVPIPRSSMLMCSANHYNDANGHTTLVYRFSSDHRSQAALGTVPCDPSPRYKFLAAWKPVPIPRSSMLMCSANHYTDANGHTTLVYRFSSDHRSQAALGTVPCDPSPRYKCLAAWKPVPIPRSSMLMCSANHYTDANGHTTLVYRFSSDHRSQAALGTVPCDPSPRYKCLAAWKPVPIPRSSMLMCSANHYTDANGHTTLVYRFSSDHRSQAALGTVPCDPSPRYKCLAAWKPVPIPRSSMLMCSANHYTDANGHTTLVYRFSSDHRSQAALGTVPCDPSPRYKCLAAWKPVPIPRSSMLMCSANHYTDANGHTTLVYRFSSDHRSQAALGTVPCDPSPRYKCLAAWKPVPIPRSSMLMCSANHYTDANGHTTLVYRFSSDHRSQAALGTVPCDPSPRYKCLAAWKPVPIPRSSMLMCSANHYTDANGHTTLVYRFSSDHRSQAALGTVPCDPSPRYKFLAAWKPVPIPRSSMLMCSANHYTDANGHTTLVYRFSSDHRSQAALGTVPCDPSPRYKFLAAWKPVPIPRSSMLMCSANHYTDANGHTTLVYRFSSDHRSQAALGTVPCDPSPRYKFLAAWKPVPIPRSSMLMCSANHYTDANGHTTLVYRFSSDHRSQAALGTVPCDPSPRYKCLAAWKPVPIPRSSMLMCSANHYTDANGHTTLVYRFSSDHRSQAALGTVPCDPSPRYKCLAAWKPVPIPRSSMLMCSANHYTDANGHTTLVYRFSSDHREKEIEQQHRKQKTEIDDKHNLKSRRSASLGGCNTDTKENEFNIKDIITKPIKRRRPSGAMEEENKKKKTIQGNEITPIPCSNRFEALSSDGESDMDVESEEANHTTKTSNKKQTNTLKTKKPTPIVIHGNTDNHARFTQILKEKLESKYYIKYQKNKIEIFTTTQDDYNKLKQEYQERKIEFHTYTLHNERRKTFVVRGLHPKMEEKDLKEDLLAQGLSLTNIHVMKGTVTPLYMISLPVTVKISFLNKKIKYICNTKVTWEDYKTKRRATQCHRCQEWGHATSNCYAEPACLKCAGKHLTQDCPKPRDQPAKCVNCDGNHPANATICEAYQKRMEWIAKKSQNGKRRPKETLNIRKIPNIEDKTSFPVMNKNTMSNTWWVNKTRHKENTYASKAAQPRYKEDNQDESELNNMSALMNELKEINKVCNIREMLEAVKELKVQLSQCKTRVQKFEVFVNFCNKLDE